MKILDIGCGKDKIKGEGVIVIGVDIDPNHKANVVHNLNKFPYPFKDDEFDEIICFNILENLENIPNVIKEIYRIGKKEQ